MPLPDDVIASFPEALRAEASLQDFKDVAGLAQSYVHTKRELGGRLPLPGPDAAPEKRTEFLKMLTEKVPGVVYLPNDATPDMLAPLWERLGKPKDEAGYKVEDEKPYADLGISVKDMRALALKAGLTNAQFKTQLDLMTEARKLEVAKFNEGHEALTKEWGAAKGDKLSAAAAAAKKLGLSDDAVKAISEGKSPAEQVRLFAAVAAAIGTNPKEGARQDGSSSAKMTPADAQASIHDIMSNRNHAYWNPADLGHKAAVARIVELQQMADPSASKDFETSSFRS